MFMAGFVDNVFNIWLHSSTGSSGISYGMMNCMGYGIFYLMSNGNKL
jgi:hypothetical protein